GSYSVTLTRNSNFSPGLGTNPTAWARPRNMTARTAAPSSFTEKYQWPDAAWVKLEISPRTQMREKLPSSSAPTRRFNWLTVHTPSPAGSIPFVSMRNILFTVSFHRENHLVKSMKYQPNSSHRSNSALKNARN